MFKAALSEGCTLGLLSIGLLSLSEILPLGKISNNKF